MDNFQNTIVLLVFGGQESVLFDLELAEKLLLISEKLSAEDFQERGSILNPRNESYLHNPIVSGTTLVLRQSLQYLQLLDARYSDLDIPNLLTSSRVSDDGILGFSSGILSAAVVTSSASIPSIIDHALEAYRLSFWIGVRVLESRLKLDSLSRWDLRPWALVLFDITEWEVKERIHLFNQDDQHICLTAYIDNSTFTVSGHPDKLAAFKQSLPDNVSTSEASINAMYHSPYHLCKAVDQVMSDIFVRGIRFPTFNNLRCPLRSSSTGDLVKLSSHGESLVQLVVKMIMIEPVRWDCVVHKAATVIQKTDLLQVLNVGLGRSLFTKLERYLSYSDNGVLSVQCIDVANIDLTVAKQEPIAIVGMAINLPKARDLDSLWELLSRGINTAEDIPLGRFDVEDYQAGKSPGRELKTAKANFVQTAAEFDNKFFNISPREANSMDPQQRLLLHVAYEALEDAGYVPDSTKSFATKMFGCYIGAATSDYLHNLREDIDVYYSTGTLSSFLSGRLSYHLSLGGPSMVIDTACSSSLVAIHQAARALIAGDCNAALAGGVNIISSPEMFMGLDRAHFLSPSGKCKPFDASADGYGRAEGCCVFVLKRLKDALLENDRVHGIIRGIEVNQSGKSHSITHPHGPTQQELFKKLLTTSAIGPGDVSFVEAHGTGTQVGDVIELESIRAALAAKEPTCSPLHIGSIKANLGHLEAASGAASLAKVLMMMRHESIPAQISFKHLNPRIPPLGNDNCRINTNRIPWSISDGKTRIALINNFGASGSNVAALVEEYHPAASKARLSTLSSYVFGLSAKDGEALAKSCASLINWLQDHPDVSMLDLSYTLTARRISYAYRLAISAITVPELISGLKRASPSRVQDEQRPTVFVFSGQGGHYAGMGSALYRSSPVFRKHINECDSILIASGFKGILPLITGEFDTTGDDLEAYQAATVSLQYGLAKLWISWGVYPTALVAHSLGEYTALVIAGCLTLRDALVVVGTRARLMFGKCGQGSTGMLSVSLSAAEVQLIMGSSKRWSRIIISCFNSPTDCVLSGPLPDLLSFQREIKSLKIHCRSDWLDVPFAFHSPAMLPILSDLQAFGNKVTMKSPSLPFASAYFGRVISPGDHSFQNPEYFAQHCIDPVRFADALEAFISWPTFAGGTAAWIEIGPHPTLLPMLKSFPQLSDSIFLPSLHKWQACWTTLTKTLAALYLFHTVNWRAVFAQIGPASVISLPSYSFSTQTFWIPFKETIPTLRKPKLDYSFIRSWVRHPSGAARANAIFETSNLEIKPFLDGHQVGGVPLCPASVYLEFAAAGTILTLKHLLQYPPDTSLSLQGVTFRRPLTGELVDGDDSIKLRLEVNPFDNTFSITSQSRYAENIPHAIGNYILQQNQVIQSFFEEDAPSVFSRARTVTTAPADIYSARTIYEVIFPRIVNYSKIFHTVRQLSLLKDGLEATATVCIGPNFSPGSFTAHPLFVDTLIHVPGFVANLQGGQTHAYICSGIASLDLIYSLLDEEATYTIYCMLVPEDEGMKCTSYAIREGQSRILVARAKGILFQRVLLSNLKARFATHSREVTNEPVDTINSRLAHMRTFDDHTDMDALESSPKSQTLWEVSPRPSNAPTSFRRVLSDVLEVDYLSIREDDELGALGLDSLSSIEIAHVFREHYRSELPSNLLSARRTVGELETALKTHKCIWNSSKPKAPFLEMPIPTPLISFPITKGLTLIQASQLQKPPLVLVHDGSGFITSYCRMSHVQRRVYGIINPNLTTSKPWLSITQMAISYAALIKKEGHRSVTLGGWSFGGIVAFEIAKVLQDSEVCVNGVLLIDTPDPFCQVPLSADLLDDILANYQPASHPVLSLGRSQFLMSSQLLGEYDPTRNVFRECTPKFAFLRSMVEYVSSNGAEVPHWLADRSDSSSMTSGWEVLIGAPMKVIDIPGHHFQAFDPSIVSRQWLLDGVG
ncbi:hypothetical protein CPB83DRAFT_941246 [Crepidotus variabilis]|uniref:Polyketide synthase n=1 Tax=Crepidotus variabilis TaxID=179855 RepID=A0A9P6EBP2_9AGAR|nr:hypothetical protein CPB83DRAFT_941246 [Crepidotus variabilis]